MAPDTEGSTGDRLGRMIEISRALMSTRGVDEVVSLILESGLELFDAEGCSLALEDRAAGELRFVAMEGAAKTAPFRIPSGQGIAGHVLKTGQPLVVDDVANDPRFHRAVDSRTGFRTRAIACVPIQQQGRNIGVVQLLNWRHPGGLPSGDLDLLSALAGLAGATLNRAHDEDRLRNARELLRQERDERHQLVPSRNPRMKEVLRVAKTAARSNATVLLLGESGTGKELFARTVHGHSARRDRPFIAINCVALTPTLLESELFGHEKGAFTGATATKKGKFELADGGTLLLDEIGDLSGDLQTKLLRVLQEQELERVGGTETLRVDVRVVAATNKDLRAAIETGGFREDLYYRLNVITISIPPLRQRREDISGLCTHFLMRACEATKRPALKLSDEVLRRLTTYPWPGNVRELANAMERLVVLNEVDTFTSDDLSSEMREPTS
ncbi:MAG: sigma 54-interacting transcriptional regulator, partial [Deltaproteobacteria bacterium]|nr:sigma 54-interacting transcriptional regulator [Deltaproteobacteria bacterium]